jgi:hypothetical protein
MLLLRSRDPARADIEGHRDAILKIATTPVDQPAGVSYLHWFQAMTLGDLGADEQRIPRRSINSRPTPSCFRGPIVLMSGGGNMCFCAASSSSSPGCSRIRRS